MKKGLVIILSFVVASFCLVATSHARPTKRLDPATQQCRELNEGILAWETEAWGTGGRKFQEVCKNCHSRDNDKNAPFLHAESYVSEAWNRIFFKRRVQCAKDGSWDVLDQEELMLVNDYLYRNGDWTYDPNNADSCG